MPSMWKRNSHTLMWVKNHKMRNFSKNRSLHSPEILSQEISFMRPYFMPLQLILMQIDCLQDSLIALRVDPKSRKEAGVLDPKDGGHWYPTWPSVPG